MQTNVFYFYLIVGCLLEGNGLEAQAQKNGKYQMFKTSRYNTISIFPNFLLVSFTELQCQIGKNR